MLATSWPDAHVVVAAGAEYISAVRDDLTKLAGTIGPKRLHVISVGTNWDATNDILAACALPLDRARVERELPGTRLTINVRVLNALLDEMGAVSQWNRQAILRRFGRQEIACAASCAETIAEAASAGSAYSRTSLSDEQVREWLRRRMQEQPSVPRTGLLRRLRDVESLACSQERFARLYKELQDEVAPVTPDQCS
jgi:hypothetical protein